MLRVNPLLL